MKIDKTKWHQYIFGDIANSISERVEPNQTDAEIYVGLEHLDPNSIHISRFGKPSDVKGTKLRVYKGDIIFGKRRAYQRKAAIADFNGICSAHAMVLRPNENIILPELFPFFLHSDAFMNKAIDISEGSLSPTIKWKILAQQKFLLPSLKQQKELAELLHSENNVEKSYMNLFSAIKLYIESTVQSVFQNSDYKYLSLNEVSKVISGYSFKSNLYTSKGLRVIRIKNVLKGEISDEDPKFYPLNLLEKVKLFALHNNDILVSLTGNVGRVGMITTKMLPAVLNQRVACIREKCKYLDKKYLFYLLRYHHYFYNDTHQN